MSIEQNQRWNIIGSSLRDLTRLEMRLEEVGRSDLSQELAVVRAKLTRAIEAQRKGRK